MSSTTSGFYCKDSKDITDMGYKLCLHNYQVTAGVNLSTTCSTLSYGTMMPHFTVQKLDSPRSLIGH